jgi:hypothetical protein
MALYTLAMELVEIEVNEFTIVFMGGVYQLLGC